ncbi:carbohydrate-binding module family 20 domain-containing protein [Natronoarchaeum sp. GCM10025703]
MGSAGQTVYLYGDGLGTDVSVQFGGVDATVVDGSENHVEVVVPNATPGDVAVTASRDGQTSNELAFSLLSGPQTQVVFHVNAQTDPGENIHVVGNVPELGDWDPAEAPEAMHNPNYPEWFLPVGVPTDTNLEFKFVKIADDGTVTWESGSNRTFTSPAQRSGVGSTPTYDWRS